MTRSTGRRWILSAGLTVARKTSKKAASEGGREFGSLVRIADDVVSDAKVVASIRGISMAKLISDTLRPIFKKALTEELRKRVEVGEK
jgi:hypothetical protein